MAYQTYISRYLCDSCDDSILLSVSFFKEFYIAYGIFMNYNGNVSSANILCV